MPTLVSTFAQFDFILQQLLDSFKFRLQLHYRLEYQNLEQQALLEADLFYKTIVPAQLNIFRQYNQMLHWCSTEHAGDSKKITEIKKYFQTQHAHLFAQHNQLEIQNWVKITHELTATKKQLQQQQLEGVQHLHIIKQKQVAQLEKLKQAAVKIVSLRLLKMPSHDEFQVMICHAKAVVNSLNLPIMEAPNDVVAVKPPVFVDHSFHQKNELLAELEQNITHYIVHLKNQSIFDRISNFFSKEHRQQKKALDAYKQIAHLPAASVAEKYDAVKKWFDHYQPQLIISKKLNIFNKLCLMPLESRLVQQQFSQLHITQQLQKNALHSHYEAINYSITTHNDAVQILQQAIQQTNHECQQLNQTLQQFISGVNEIEDTPLGFIQNGNPQLLHQQTAIKQQLKVHNPELDLAQQLTEEIMLLPRHASIQQLQALQLKVRMKKISDPAAIDCIHKTVDKLLDSTEQFGGKNNNFNFIGTSSMQYIVEKIGTKQQCNRFQKLKPMLEQQRQLSKNNQLHLEAEHLLHLLMGELNNGVLNKKLMHWWEAYQKHKRIDGQIPDEATENIYKTKIQYYSHLAKKVSQTGSIKLQQFVQHVMDEFIAHQPKLSLESGTMLLLIFGSEAQNTQWKTLILPQYDLRQVQPLRANLLIDRTAT